MSEYQPMRQKDLLDENDRLKIEKEIPELRTLWEKWKNEPIFNPSLHEGYNQLTPEETEQVLSILNITIEQLISPSIIETQSIFNRDLINWDAYYEFCRIKKNIN